MKKNVRFYVVGSFISLLLICYSIYIFRSGANIVFQDQFDQIPILDKLINGNLTFSDLWQAHLEHRVLGYNIIAVINASLFNVNTLVEMYFGGGLLAGTAFIIYYSYFKSNLGSRHSYLTVGIFLVISALLFSLIQWENIVLSLGMSIILRMLVFVSSILIFDNLLLNGISKLKISLLILFLGLSILVFGSGYSPAIVVSLLVVLVIAFLENPTSRRKILILSGAIMASSIVFYILYFHDIYVDNLIVEDKSIIEKIMYILQNLFDAVKFFLVTIASSIIGVNIFEKYLSDSVMIALGFIILLIIFVHLFLYFKEKLFKKSWVPFIFILYSFMIMGLIMIGRFNYGLTYGSSSRYTTDTQYLIIGLLWIIALLIGNSNKKLRLNWKLLLHIIPIVGIISSFVITNVVEWKISSSRGAYFANLQKIALNIENATDDELSLFQYPPDIVRSGLKFLKDNSLNIYDNNLLATENKTIFSENIISVEGFYDDEGGSRWTKKNVELLLTQLDENYSGKLHVQTYVPAQLANTEITVIFDDEAIMNIELSEGENNFEIPIKGNGGNMSLKIVQSKSFVPKELGINEDIRELGIMINKMYFE